MTATWAARSFTSHPVRSALTISGIGIATALLASTLAFQWGYERSLKRNIDSMGFQVLVTGKGCPHEAATLILRGGAIPMYVPQEVADHITGWPEVQDTTRFFMQAVPLDDGRSSQLWVGVDENFLRLKPGVEFQRGGWFTSPSADEVILGYNVAEFRRLGPGGEVEILGRKMKVQGVLDKLGTQDDGTIFLPLEVGQSIFGKRDLLTGIGLRLHDPVQAAAVIDRLYDIPSVQVVRMAQVQGTILGILQGVRGLLMAFGTLCLVVALLGVLNVSLIAAQERRAEMGLLRAMGCPAGTLFKLVWSESALLSAGGGLAGALLAVALRGAAEHAVRASLSFVPGGDVVVFTPALLAGTCGAVVLLGLAAGAYPAWRSSVTAPLDSIRGA